MDTVGYCQVLSTAVRFLTWTLRNVFYVRVAKRFVRLWRSQAREQSSEEATGETEVGRRLLPPPLVPWTRPAVTQTEPNLNQRPPRPLFWWKLDNIIPVILATVVATTATLSSNSFKMASFLCILLPFYGNSSPRTIRFLGKRTVTSERSR